MIDAALEKLKMQFALDQSDEAKGCGWKTKMHSATWTVTTKKRLVYDDVSQPSAADLLVVAF